MSAPRTKTVCTEVSSDAEWIWRAAAEDVLPAAVRRAQGGRTARAGWQAQARSATPYQDMTVSHCLSRYVTFLASWRGHPGQTPPGRSPVTSHRRAPHCSPPHRHQRLPRIGSHRGRRLDAQPPAEVLARIGVVVDVRILDLWDTAACLQGQAISGARRPRLTISVPQVRPSRWSGARPDQLR
jgi:hypothetical protein